MRNASALEDIRLRRIMARMRACSSLGWMLAGTTRSAPACRPSMTARLVALWATRMMGVFVCARAALHAALSSFRQPATRIRSSSCEISPASDVQRKAKEGAKASLNGEAAPSDGANTQMVTLGAITGAILVRSTLPLYAIQGF